jgi:hypothetical protein
MCVNEEAFETAMSLYPRSKEIFVKRSIKRHNYHTAMALKFRNIDREEKERNSAFGLSQDLISEEVEDTSQEL